MSAASLFDDLRVSLTEAKRGLEAAFVSAPPDDVRALKSFLKRLCRFMGETSMFAPTLTRNQTQG